MDKEELFQIKSNTLEVNPGDVLLSEPFLLDMYFSRAVVLIMDHNEEDGTCGIIINKRIPVTINDVVDDFPMFDADVYIGGPVKNDNVFFTHTLGNMVPESTEICKGVYWSNNFNVIKSLIRCGLVTRFDIRFFLGYCGWDAGQLRDELRRNSWIVGKMSTKAITMTNPKVMWETFTKATGKRYQLWSKFPLNPNDN